MIAAQDIKTIGVVGTGLIGASWTTYFLSQGFTVRATDPAPNAKEKLYAFITKAWQTLADNNLIKDNASLDNLSFDEDMHSALANVDFVQENAPERLEFKIDLIAQISNIVRPNVIIASSSSGLLPSDFQINANLPERVLLGHPFNPLHIIPLVEVVGGKLTAPHYIDQAMAFYQAIGKTPIRLNKEIKGHIANRLQFALFREVMYLLENEVASVADIDKAVSEGLGLRWAIMGQFMTSGLGGGEGGFGHMMAHLGGAIEDWWADLGTLERINPETVRQVDTELRQIFSKYPQEKIIKARDELIIETIKAKKATTDLPE